MSSTVRRLLGGFSGQAAWRGIIVVYSIAIIPLMIHAWGLRQYGEWLTLTALATYLSTSNYGLTAASSMEIIAAVNRGDTARARTVLSATLAVVGPVVVLASTLLMVALFTFDFARVFHVSLIAGPALRILICALVVQVVAQTIRGMLFAASNSSGAYGQPYALSSVWRVFELVGTIVALTIFHAGPAVVAALVALSATLDCLTQYLLARRLAPWIDIRPDFRAMAILKPLITPSVGQMTMSFAVNAISVQGVRLVIGATIGSAAVAIFSVYTTLLRLSEHCINLVLPSIQLEFARESSDQTDKTLSIIRFSTFFGLTIHLALTVGVLIFGWWFIPFWTGGSVQLSYEQFILLALASLATQVNRPLQALLLGRNITGRLALLTILATLSGLLAGGLLAGPLHLVGIASGLTLGEVLAFAASVVIAAKVLGRSSIRLLRDQFDLGAIIRQAATFLRSLRASRGLSRS